MAKFKQNQNQGRGQQPKGRKAALTLKKKSVQSPRAGDARLKIMAKGRKKLLHGDAREKLASIAKETDARKKLEKIRNLKAGKFDVKKTKKGGITIVTTTQGQLQLTTKRKEAQSRALGGDPHANVTKIGKNLTKSVNLAGKVSLSTKPKVSALSTSSTGAKSKKSANTKKPTGARPKLTKTIKSKAAQLDDELMNTHVDPVVIRRTVKQSVVRDRSRSPVHMSSRYRSRSRSPIRNRDYDRHMYHYDDPRREAREEEILRQRIRDAELRRREHDSSYLTSEMMANTTPLAGTKVVVSNLGQGVSQEDLRELFGDIGYLRHVKIISSSGRTNTAEIVYQDKDAAEKAISVYHNRQLDGQPMKCQLVSTGGSTKSPMSSLRLPASRRLDDDHHRGAPDISSIHKALFSERKTGTAVPYASSGGNTAQNNSGNQKITVVMPKQGHQAPRGRNNPQINRRQRR